MDERLYSYAKATGVSNNELIPGMGEKFSYYMVTVEDGLPHVALISSGSVFHEDMLRAEDISLVDNLYSGLYLSGPFSDYTENENSIDK